MPMKHLITPVLATAAFGVAACGDDSETKKESADTPAVALRELAETRAGVTAALAAYKAGDKKKADDAAAEAYLEHFEHVEGPLEAKDAELKEELEHHIRDDLRAAIKAGKPAAEIEGRIEEIHSEMDRAEALLK